MVCGLILTADLNLSLRFIEQDSTIPNGMAPMEKVKAGTIHSVSVSVAALDSERRQQRGIAIG